MKTIKHKGYKEHKGLSALRFSLVSFVFNDLKQGEYKTCNS